MALLCTLALGRDHVPTPRQRQDASLLAAELGRLPLALEQAGAYLFEPGTSLADYRVMLGHVMDTAVGGIDPARTVARIRRHTLTAVGRHDPRAIRLLDAMAWLGPDDIPRTLLAPLCPDPLGLGEALGVLHRYNMVAFSGTRVSRHRLVQAVLRGSPPAPGSSSPPGREDAERVLQLAVARDDPDRDPESAADDRQRH
ncbi:hypothetical protein [Streptomyces antibioticus]|uniref:hypothetical protein n=1 Tax=Streptomyces antibioticus TaxID=1890 RepID=UPI003F46368F